jgi:hypothetical protein
VAAELLCIARWERGRVDVYKLYECESSVWTVFLEPLVPLSNGRLVKLGARTKELYVILAETNLQQLAFAPAATHDRRLLLICTRLCLIDGQALVVGDVASVGVVDVNPRSLDLVVYKESTLNRRQRCLYCPSTWILETLSFHHSSVTKRKV